MHPRLQRDGEDSAPLPAQLLALFRRLLGSSQSRHFQTDLEIAFLEFPLCYTFKVVVLVSNMGLSEFEGLMRGQCVPCPFCAEIPEIGYQVCIEG